MRLIAYVRVSSAGQASHGHSLDDQPERLQAYCAAYGYTLVDVISEQISARKVPLDKRQGGAELLRRLAEGKADGVIVIKLDRLFRDLRDGLNYFSDALYGRGRGRNRRAGPQVVSLSEHIDTSTAAGRTMLKFSLLDADSEADRTSERTTYAMQGLRKRGRVYGHVPYGCVKTGGRYDAAQGRVVEQQLFREPGSWAVRERIVAMSRGQGMSLPAIVDVLHAEGIAPSRGGRKWRTSTLWQLVQTHHELEHLPLLDGAQSAVATPQADEAAVSVAGEGGHVQ